MEIALVLFGLAALGGVFLATRRFRNKELPFVVAVLHGVAAVSGLITLGLAVMNGTAAGTATIALGVFAAAALGGLFLFSFQLRRRLLPKPVIVIHALVAVTGLVLLLAAVFG